MRRALELVLLLSGALGLALGLDALAKTGAIQQALALSGGGAAVLLAGLALSFYRAPSAQRAARQPSQRVPGPLGIATLAFNGTTPAVVSRDDALEVTVDRDGTVRLRLKTGTREGRLICRAGPAYFNTLKQDGQEAAIKLIGPMPPLVRLELWDGSDLKKSA
jgi:hypothetical protein